MNKRISIIIYISCLFSNLPIIGQNYIRIHDLDGNLISEFRSDDVDSITVSNQSSETVSGEWQNYAIGSAIIDENFSDCRVLIQICNSADKNTNRFRAIFEKDFLMGNKFLYYSISKAKNSNGHYPIIIPNQSFNNPNNTDKIGNDKVSLGQYESSQFDNYYDGRQMLNFSVLCYDISDCKRDEQMPFNIRIILDDIRGNKIPIPNEEENELEIHKLKCNPILSSE